MRLRVRGRKPRRRGVDPFSVLGVLLIVAGVGAILLGLVSLGHSVRLMLSGRTALATVVERTEHPARRGPVFRPTFEFQDDEGRTHRVRSTLTSRGEDFEVGARVELIYLPGSPGAAEMRDGRLQWFGRGVPVLLGGLAALLGWAMLVPAEERSGKRRRG